MRLHSGPYIDRLGLDGVSVYCWGSAGFGSNAGNGEESSPISMNMRRTGSAADQTVNFGDESARTRVDFGPF